MADLGEIVPFGEQKIINWQAARLDMIKPGESLAAEEVYLATDIYQGSFGVASYGLVIPRPNARQSYYTPQEGPCGPYYEEDVNWRVGDDPTRRAHFLDTDKGFAVDRTVVAPSIVIERLSNDRFLGPAIVNKCCIEGTVSPELDEEYELRTMDSFGWEKYDHIGTVQQRVIAQLEDVTDTEYRIIREYPSWHNYRLYATVLGEIAAGCQATVANFDEVLLLLAKDMPRLHDFSNPASVLGKAALAISPPETK